MKKIIYVEPRNIVGPKYDLRNFTNTIFYSKIFHKIRFIKHEYIAKYVASINN